MWYSFIQTSGKDGSARTELVVDRRIRDYARPIETLAWCIVRGIRRAVGVARVSASLPVLSGPAQVLWVRMAPSPWVTIPRALASVAGLVGDAPCGLEWPLVGQVWRRYLGVPYQNIEHVPDAHRWQVSYVWPGAYVAPPEHPITGDTYYLDPISGVEFADGHIVRIWPTAPLAHYAWDRMMIPLDVAMTRDVDCLAYRRHGETLAFVAAPDKVGDTRAAIERIMAVYELDYSITIEPY